MSAVRQVMAWSARHSDCVIVQTPTMKEWVSRGLGITDERVVVVEPDAAPLPRAAAAPELEEMRQAARHGRAFLYVGNASPYKNLEVFESAMAEVARALPGSVLFAALPPGHVVAKSPHVRALPYLSKSGLREAYELAGALVMPSLVETVGLPMLEAASIGTPVVAADRPYARDVCGAAALYFDPRSGNDLAAKLTVLMTDRAVRERIVSNGFSNAERRRATRPYEQMIEVAVTGIQGVPRVAY